MIPGDVLERVRYRTLYPAAAAFIGDYGTMTESQMNGLRALFAAGQSLDKIKAYIKKRIERSQEAGHPEQQRFWAELEKEIAEYRGQARGLLGLEKLEERDVTQFIEAFIVLLCAENRYRQKVSNETDGEERERTREERHARQADQAPSFHGSPRFRHGTPPRGRGGRDRGTNR